MRAHSIHSFLKSLAIVIPVFYNVKPSDLRWTNKDGQYAGRYARALFFKCCMLFCFLTGEDFVCN
jgi:hypothetical protein